MTGFLIRRILQMIIVLFFVTVITLLLVHLFPGGPIRALLGARASAAQVAYYNRLYGFNQPLYEQYGKWIGQLLHGNFGYDLSRNATVASLMVPALVRTIVLAVIGTLVGLLIGVPLGIYQAVHRYTVADHVATGISFIGYGAPTFFVGILLINWFSVQVHIFNLYNPGNSLLSQPGALVLPVITYAFVAFALWSRFMRSSVMDNIIQDYVRTARSKGASERRVIWGHIFRNSLISIVTLLGLQLPLILGGAVFIEVVFNYPGMGLLFVQSALNTDIQLMLAITVLTTLVTILGNLLADITYGMLDPRVRYA